MANIPPIKKIFFEPKEFFQSIANETDYLKPWLFFVVISFIYFVITQVISIIQSLLVSPVQALGAVIAVVFGFFIYIPIMLVSPFIGAGIIHLGAMILGVRGEFVKTFKVVCYSVVVAYIYGIISAILISPLALAQAGNIMYLAFLAPVLIIALISIIHQFYVEITGLSMYHSISKLKAFFSIILVPLILLILLFLFAILIIALIGGMTGMAVSDLPNMMPFNF